MTIQNSIIFGTKIGRWTLLAVAPSPKSPRILCRCQCGTEKSVNRSSLILGRTKSCGCLKKERDHNSSTHSHTSGRITTATYNSWRAMRDRCLRKTNIHYKHYGARGISICERWSRFENFLADMGERPVETTLDRYPDNSGNYEPQNCRWATRSEQMSNRRPYTQGLYGRKVRPICFNGETLKVSDWARRLGINCSSLIQRLDKWPLEKAMTAPKRSSRIAIQASMKDTP